MNTQNPQRMQTSANERHVFSLPPYHEPDWTLPSLKDAPDCRLEPAPGDGLAPEGYHALSIFPEYFRVNGRWILPAQSRMDTVCVIDNTPGGETADIVEFRRLKKGDLVVCGRNEDASEGIFVWDRGFAQEDESQDLFAFRTGRSRETAFSRDYDELYSLMRYEKEHGGQITFVSGMTLARDVESRAALASLIRSGYVNALFCGSETAALDLACGIDLADRGQFAGRNPSESEALAIWQATNAAHTAGSVEQLISSGQVHDGFIKAAVETGIPVVIAGTIRDPWLLPGAYDDVYAAQDAMRDIVRGTTTIIFAAAILFTIATGNMTPSYCIQGDRIRPLYMYTVDLQEFAVNKLADRGTLTARPIVTSAHDFVVNLDHALTERP